VIGIVTIMMMPNPVEEDERNRDASAVLSQVLEVKAKAKPAAVLEAKAEPAVVLEAKEQPAAVLGAKAEPAAVLEAKAKPAAVRLAKAPLVGRAARMLASDAPDLHKRSQTEPTKLNAWTGKHV
jgi:hypothetical protein